MRIACSSSCSFETSAIRPLASILGGNAHPRPIKLSVIRWLFSKLVYQFVSSNRYTDLLIYKCQLLFTVNCPAVVNVITPPHRQDNWHVLLTTGVLPAITVDEPGVHGATVLGTQGWGVNTPCAAAVAAATCGLLGVVHMPNGAMLTIGALSIIVATA